MAILFNLMYPKICFYAFSPAPPLTVGNTLKALEGVEDWGEVASWLGTYSSSLKEAVELFLQGRCRYQPSWRAVIFALDGAEETPVASRIRSYGEPVQGRYTYTHLCKKLELCRAHTPREHCAIYAIAFASVHAWLFCELQKVLQLPEVLVTKSTLSAPDLDY